MLKLNDHVRLISDVDLFPTGIYRAGLTGRVTSHDGYMAKVTLNQFFPELAEWDNALQVGIGSDRADVFPCIAEDFEVITPAEEV